MIRLLAHPLSPSSLSDLDRRHPGKLRKRVNLLMGEGERGWWRSRIIRPQESLVLCKAFTTLCLKDEVLRNRSLFTKVTNRFGQWTYIYDMLLLLVLLKAKIKTHLSAPFQPPEWCNMDVINFMLKSQDRYYVLISKLTLFVYAEPLKLYIRMYLLMYTT